MLKKSKAEKSLGKTKVVFSTTGEFDSFALKWSKVALVNDMIKFIPSFLLQCLYFSGTIFGGHSSEFKCELCSSFFLKVDT